MFSTDYGWVRDVELRIAELGITPTVQHYFFETFISVRSQDSLGNAHHLVAYIEFRNLLATGPTRRTWNLVYIMGTLNIKTR